MFIRDTFFFSETSTYLGLKSVAGNRSEEVWIELLVAEDNCGGEIADLRHVEDAAKASNLKRNLPICHL